MTVLMWPLPGRTSPLLPAAPCQQARKQKVSLFFHKQLKRLGKSRISVLVQELLQLHFSALSQILQELPFFCKTGHCLPWGDFSPLKTPPCPSRAGALPVRLGRQRRAGGGEEGTAIKPAALTLLPIPPVEPEEAVGR